MKLYTCCIYFCRISDKKGVGLQLQTVSFYIQSKVNSKFNRRFQVLYYDTRYEMLTPIWIGLHLAPVIPVTPNDRLNSVLQKTILF